MHTLVRMLAGERFRKTRPGRGAFALRRLEQEIGGAGGEARDLSVAGQGLRGAGDERIAQFE